MDSNNIMQSQNFEFLRHNWPELASLCGFAEQYVHWGPDSSTVKLRAFAERVVKIVYRETELPKPAMANFMELFSNHAFESVTPKVIIDKLHAVRIHGNKAAHGDKVCVNNALWFLRESWDLARWLFATYAEGDAKALGEFSKPAQTSSEKSKYKKERKALLEQYARQEAQMQALLAELEQEKEKIVVLEKTEAELSVIHQKAQATAYDLHFDKDTTRKRLIDMQLAGSGWDVGENGENTEEVTQEELVLK